MKQRSKVGWLRLGDKNTKFFSIAIRIRKSKNSTLRILNPEGNIMVSRDNIERKSINYFTGLFRNEGEASPIPITFPRIVSPQMNDWLIQQPTEEEEVRNTLFSFNLGKSPGLDGFTIEFFRAF